ncbi:fimbrial protein [Burkholderia ubonensis]|uniref:fimbria/pilus outer membrane usher protein n=1 Tax=Burkholderia ubonensis TaxID=101571 RepID=UPI00075C8BBF|nr:fimbria/pilus outer membrane usher protein [Burkholderia ubonensis]KWI37049.1 fimbrial protein [Burkholderia ubonensis]OJB18450.1 fimbrial protein [Burkholderia ubonensis]
MDRRLSLVTPLLARKHAFVASHRAKSLSVAVCLVFAEKAQAFKSDIEPAEDSMSEFNTDFLHGGSADADLTGLTAESSVPPGTYRVMVQVNGDLVARDSVEFRRANPNGAVQPCLTAAMLKEWGVDLRTLPTPLDESSPACVDVPAAMKHASVEFDAGQLQLNLSIPQAYLARGERGYVDPALWDHGVAAGYVNYQYTGSFSHGRFVGNEAYHFLGLQSGMSVGRWRVRNESTVSVNPQNRTEFISNRTLVQRDVTAIKGQLTLGEQYTDASLFNSVRILGAQITSDEAMRPDSEQGYAPVVRGQAASNAIVEIRQNNYVLYRANVPPGPFEISDIFPSGSNGDLEITVIEADGSRHVTHQAFSSLPLMVRKGRLKYAFSAGKYQDGQGGRAPALVTGSLVYGLTDNGTVLGGFQYSPGFTAINVGVGANSLVGALSFDITQSMSRAQGASRTGQSIRMLFAKSLTRTNTNFTLAAYRYSTAGYRTFDEHLRDVNSPNNIPVGGSRARVDLTISQLLGGKSRSYGSAYLNFSRESYWGRSGTSQSLNLGYGNSWRQVGYNVTVSRIRDPWRSGRGMNDTQVALSVSMPLGGKVRSPRMYTSANFGGGDAGSVQAGVSGYFGDKTSYTAQTGYSGSGGDANATFGVSRPTSIAQLNASFSYSRNYQSLNVGAAGAVVAHRGGVNFSQTVGDTFALIQVDGVRGTDLRTEENTSISRNGYGVLTYLQPYRVHNVQLDTRNLGADVELKNTVSQVVPRRGAIVKAKFDGYTGRRAMFDLRRSDGGPVPLGATVSDAESGKQLAVTNPFGRALVLLERDEGRVVVNWKDNKCHADYALPPRNPDRNYQRQILHCR